MLLPAEDPIQALDRWPKTLRVLEEGRIDGLHTGAQMAISTRQGLEEINHGEARPGEAMRSDSIPLWLSAGKPIVAVALARLVEQGRLDWDDPVISWIPEFGGGGKDPMTLRHLLTHTGGFRGADRDDPTWPWEDSVAHACAASLEPDWIVGETAGYHANGSWFILGEVLQRATGRSFMEVIRSEVSKPLELADGWFGIEPTAQAHMAGRLVRIERTGRGERSADPILNDPRVIERCRPGSGLRATARSLAALYRGLLHPPRGWLSRESMDQLVSPQRRGSYDRTFLAVIDFGLGFILNSDRPSSSPVPYGYGLHAGPRTFGHSGNQSACAFADPDHDLTVAWVCNGLPGELLHQRRQRAINAAIYEDLGIGPGAGTQRAAT